MAVFRLHLADLFAGGVCGFKLNPEVFADSALYLVEVFLREQVGKFNFSFVFLHAETNW
jgi:hypothetical protein